MDYNWSIKDIKRQLRYFEHLQIKNPGITDIEQGIILLNEFIETLQDQNTKKSIDTESILDAFTDETKYLLSRDFSLKHCQKLCNLTTGVNVFQENRKLDYTKDELLSIVHDFFRDAVGGNLFELFLKDFNIRYTHVRFNSDSKIVGQNFYIPIIEESYIEAQFNKDFFDIADLAHEYGHGIHFRGNFKQQLLSKVDPFGEVISTFFELLAYHWFSSTALAREAIITNGNIWNEYLNDAIKLANEIELIRFYQNSCSKNIRHLRSMAQKQYQISKEKFDYLFQNHNSKNLSYIFSLTIAIELLYIYKQDRDKAFYIINKIFAIKVINSQVIFNEFKKLGVYPNAHVVEYEQELKRELKLVS